MRLAVCVVLIGILAAVPSLKASDAEPRVRLAWKLADALGDDNYQVREAARDGLFNLGRASIEPLEFAVRSEDSEVRLRATELLIALRGRGFLGIGMQQRPVSEKTPPDRQQFWQVLVNFIQQYHPAETAGLLGGDVILELNGKSIQDINQLQKEVIVAGPARVISALIERNGERMFFPILLTMNITPVTIPMRGFVPVRMPPINLETELPRETRTVKRDDTGPEIEFMGIPMQAPLPAATLPQDAELISRIEAQLQKARKGN